MAFPSTLEIEREISSMTIFICRFCGSERKSKKSLTGHETFCKQNPNRSKHDHSAAGKLASHDIQIQNKKVRIENYNKNPNVCKKCQVALEYNKKQNEFCSHSCSAAYNNRHRQPVSYSEYAKEKLKLINKKIKVVTYRLKCKVCNKSFWAKSKHIKTCGDKCRREIFRETAKNNPKMGGNKNTRAYGWYKSKYAGTVWLESSWEHFIAKSLDVNNITWSRPRYLCYGNKKYFPDFYLHDYNVYLDPKNPYLQKVDLEKIKSVQEENNVKILVLNKYQLEWNTIKQLINAL